MAAGEDILPRCGESLLFCTGEEDRTADGRPNGEACQRPEDSRENEAQVCEIEHNTPNLARTCEKESSADGLHGGSRARRNQIQVCRLATMISFLDLPPEIRLPIYAHFLDEQTRIYRNRQPRNGHYRLLHVCRAIYYEARPTFRTYVSLAYERQINAFIRCADPEDFTHILWADVANDGRYLSNVDPRLLQKESSSEVSGE